MKGFFALKMASWGYEKTDCYTGKCKFYYQIQENELMVKDFHYDTYNIAQFKKLSYEAFYEKVMSWVSFCEKRLRERFPEIEFESISDSKIKEIYEIVQNHF